MYSLSLEKTESFIKLSLHLKNGLCFRDGLDLLQPRGFYGSITDNLVCYKQFMFTECLLIQ